jgi:PAS domain S-box-containing protein
MLSLVSDGQPLPPSKHHDQPDELDRIEDGISEQSLTIQSSQDRLIQAKEIAENEVIKKRQAQVTLLQISSQNRMLLECVGEGIYGVDTDGLTTFINPAGSKMIGWSPEELIGKPQHDIMHHTRANGTPFPSEECPIHAAINVGKVQQISGEVFWRKDGGSFPVEYMSTPIVEGEKIVGAVVVFRDITKRQLTEQQTQRLLVFQRVLNIIHQISFEAISLEQQLDSALQTIMSIPW